MSQQYAIGDHVMVRTDPVRATKRTTWHQGFIEATDRVASHLWITRYLVRLETGADRGSVILVDRRNLRPIAIEPESNAC